MFGLLHACMKLLFDEMTPTMRWVVGGGAAIMLSVVTVWCFWARSKRPFFYEDTRIPASYASLVAGVICGWVGCYTILGFLPLYFLVVVAASMIAAIIIYLRDRQAAQNKNRTTK